MIFWLMFKATLAAFGYQIWKVLGIIFGTFFDIVKMWKNARRLHESTKIEGPAAQGGIQKSIRKWTRKYSQKRSDLAHFS